MAMPPFALTPTSWMLITLASVVVGLTSCQSAPADRQPATSRSINERPMYGGIPKTDAMKRADEEYIQTILDSGHTRESGSDKAAELGFQYAFKGDHGTAMKRFNQAWLLDPDNGETYHGFAVVLIDRDNDVVGALAMFEKAIAARRVTAVAFADYGKLRLMLGQTRPAIPLLERSLEMDSNNRTAHANLALAYWESGLIGKACKQAPQAFKATGGPGLTPPLIKAVGGVLASPQCV